MKDHRIFIVTYPGETVTATSKAHYAPLNEKQTKYTLDDAHAEVKRLRQRDGKCYGIVDANDTLVHESSQYYANMKLPVKG